VTRLRLLAGCFLLAVLGAAFLPARALAQNSALLTPDEPDTPTNGFDSQRQTPTPRAQAQPEPPPKPPPVPLFPKHRRGLYLNGLGLEVLDATPQSPPLETDDPGVPERGVYEINLTMNADLSRESKEFDLFLVDANYGLLPKILGHELPTQLKFEVPVAGAKDSGQPFTAGIGAAKVGLKFNLYNNEQHGIELSVYPQIEFVPGSRPVEKGLAEPGQTLIFPLLVAKELKYATLVVNAALNKPFHDPDRHTTGTFNFAVGVPVTRRFAAMAELHSESRFDAAQDRLVAVNVGLMRSLGSSMVLYTHVGHSLFSDEGVEHTYAGGGVKLLIKPDAKKSR
jgi:hypothetical protein